MYQDFIAALNRKYGCSGEADLSGMDLQHYSFAATTNMRGIDTLKIFEAYGFSISGLHILDVGCAYGGFSIEAARRGACCYGVEISQPLYEFALLNGRNEIYEGGRFCLTALHIIRSITSSSRAIRWCTISIKSNSLI